MRPGLALAATLALALALVSAPGAARVAAAADVVVHGVVRDAHGAPVEYATVNVPALKRGVATDGEGRFTLTLPEGASSWSRSRSATCARGSVSTRVPDSRRSRSRSPTSPSRSPR